MLTQTCSRNQELTVRILLIDIETQGGSEITDGVLTIRLWAEAVIRYRHQVIRVVHHEIGEEHCGLTFTVNFGVAPRSFDTLSGACEYIDGSVDELERLGLQQHALTQHECQSQHHCDGCLRQTGEGSLT